MKLGLSIVGALAILPLAACATLPPGGRDAAAERGRAFAERACGECHGLDQDPSAWSTAPPFRAMSLDVNGVLNERRMAQLTHSHVTMPPLQVSEADLRDLAAYVRKLKLSEGSGVRGQSH